MFVTIGLLSLFILLVVAQALRSYRYSTRKRGSTNWPVVSATVEKGEAQFRGPLLSLWAVKVPKALFGYSYHIDGIRYLGFFVVVCKDWTLGEAQTLKEQLEGTRLDIQYDPTHPEMSLIVDHEIMGRQIHQGPEWIPPSLSA